MLGVNYLLLCAEIVHRPATTLKDIIVNNTEAAR